MLTNSGFKDLLSLFKKEVSSSVKTKEVKKEVVTSQISGVDIMELENAVAYLLENDLYAEAGMGCTGPIVMVNEKNEEKARDLLVKKDYI